MATTYVAYQLIKWGLSYWEAFFATLAIAFVLGTVLELALVRPVQHRSVIAAVIVTVGLFVLIDGVVNWIWGGDFKYMATPFGTKTYHLGGVSIARLYPGMLGVVLVSVVLVWALFRFTKLGLGMRAAALRPAESALVGVRVDWMLAIGWGLAAVLGAVAGLMAEPSQFFLDPTLMQPILVYALSLAARVGIYFIAVVGLNVLTGYTGQISIGHGAFMAVGGYTTAVMSRDHHTSLILTMLLALAICFVLGLLVGLPALRLSGVYLALATFALAVSVPQLPLKWSKFLGGRDGVQTSRTVSHTWLYGAAWTASAILFVLAWLILRGRVGRAFRAVRDSEIAAVASGIELPVYKTLAFGISAAYAGVAGSLFVLATNGFAAPDEFGVVLSLQLLVGAAVAGLGSLWGVLAGAVFVGLLPTVSSSVPVIGSNHGRDVVFGAAVVLVMLLLPGGSAGLLARLRRSAGA